MLSATWDYVIPSHAFRLQDFHSLRFTFPGNSSIHALDIGYLTVLLNISRYPIYATPVCLTRIWFGLSRFRSPLLTLSLRFLFLRLLRCFTSPGSPLFRGDILSYTGFPHSGILASTVACSSTRLFAACHALRRLLLPRHPPCALITLT